MTFKSQFFSEFTLKLWTAISKIIHKSHEADYTYFDIISIIGSSGFNIKNMVPAKVIRSVNEKLCKINDFESKHRILNLLIEIKII